MRLFVSAVLLLLGLASLASSQAGGDSGVASKIVAVEQLWNQAYKSADITALDSVLDERIVLVSDDGSVQTKSAFLASVKVATAQPAAQQQQVSPESLKVHVYGNVAIATGVMRVKGVENGKSYTRHERFVDTWLLKGSNWICIGTNATPVLH